MAKLLDVNGAPLKQENNPPPKDSPQKEILRVIRIIETARRMDLAELCATLEQVASAGWSLTMDDNLPTDKVEATIVHHIGRTVENKMTQRGERWIRLGNGFTEAMTLLKENHGK